MPKRTGETQAEVGDARRRPESRLRSGWWEGLAENGYTLWVGPGAEFALLVYGGEDVAGAFRIDGYLSAVTDPVFRDRATKAAGRHMAARSTREGSG